MELQEKENELIINFQINDIFKIIKNNYENNILSSGDFIKLLDIKNKKQSKKEEYKKSLLNFYEKAISKILNWYFLDKWFSNNERIKSILKIEKELKNLKKYFIKTIDLIFDYYLVLGNSIYLKKFNSLKPYQDFYNFLDTDKENKLFISISQNWETKLVFKYFLPDFIYKISNWKNQLKHIFGILNSLESYFIQFRKSDSKQQKDNFYFYVIYDNSYLKNININFH